MLGVICSMDCSTTMGSNGDLRRPYTCLRLSVMHVFIAMTSITILWTIFAQIPDVVLHVRLRPTKHNTFCQGPYGIEGCRQILLYLHTVRPCLSPKPYILNGTRKPHILNLDSGPEIDSQQQPTPPPLSPTRQGLI